MGLRPRRGGWGNAELEVYTDARENSAIESDPTAGDGRAVVITGTAGKRVLLRAVGPALATAGLAADTVLADPVLELYRGSAVIAANDNWATNANSAEIVTTGARVGATPLHSSDLSSSALLLTLSAVTASFVTHGKADGRGIVLIEVYDTDQALRPNKVAFPGRRRFLIEVAMKLPALLFAVVFLVCGCSSVHTRHDPRVKMDSFQRFYVQHRLTDDHHIDETIVAELKALGRHATCGPLTMMPDDTEVLVTYEDTWQWDFRSYLIQLNITLQRARRDEVVALGSYRQPTPIPKPPAEVVHAILAPLFKGRQLP